MGTAGSSFTPEESRRGATTRWGCGNGDPSKSVGADPAAESSSFSSHFINPRVASNLAPDGDVDGIYFVDGYSTTYPSEDRARIFENLATFAPEDRPAAFSGKNMQLKAAYLCAALRDAYDSIAQAEDVFWEHGLNAEYTLDWFRENYDLEEYWSTVEPKG